MANKRIVLEVDEDDYRDIVTEIAHYQAVRRRSHTTGELLLPDGESDIAGAIIGEIVRDLREYREHWERENPR